MGLEIAKEQFDQSDKKIFSEKIKKETALLHQLLSDKTFSNQGFSFGYEMEFWLLENLSKPSPQNAELLERISSDNFVTELARFNLEYNSRPYQEKEWSFEKTQRELKEAWDLARNAAKDLDRQVACFGILPTLERHHLQEQFMSKDCRYQALNDSILGMRQNQDFHINIDGKDHLSFHQKNILAGAATSSLQIHLKIPVDLSHRAYNASLLSSVPMVALAANSPSLFGKELWAETRIPLLEQSVDPVTSSAEAKRVTFGRSYVQDSIYELFKENLDHYPVLLPVLQDKFPKSLSHLNMHNGTIWRWNRAIVCNENQSPHLRIEHRVPSAGPTIDDTLANIFFFCGLTIALAESPSALEKEIPFETLENDFYQAAKEGLDAHVHWNRQETFPLKELIINELIPLARQGLQGRVPDSTINKAFNQVILPRTQSGQNGSQWQLNFIKNTQKSCEEMVRTYTELASQNQPVHLWPCR